MRWGGSSEWKTSPISFGTVVIGEAPDEDSVFGFSIYNAGGDVGGGLSGRSTLSPDTGQYLCKWAGCEDNGCADKCDCVDGAVVYENIHPGRFCSTRIRFVPHTAGEDNPVIRLSNTVVPSQFEERGFSALGVDNSSDSVNVDLGESDFGRVYIGHTKNKTFRFSNTGTSNLGPGVFLTSSPFSCVEARDNLGNVVPNCGYNIAPGSFANVTVKFSPTAQQRYLSDVVLSVPPGMITYPITGEGVKMRIFKFLEL
jgi:hypothetical protein